MTAKVCDFDSLLTQCLLSSTQKNVCVGESFGTVPALSHSHSLSNCSVITIRMLRPVPTCRALLIASVSRMEGFTLQRSFAAWHHLKVWKASRRHRAESAVQNMRLSRKRTLFTAWQVAQHRAQHKQALLSKALAHMRHAVLPAAFNRWQQYWVVKSSLRIRAHIAREQIQLHRKQSFLTAWHAVQQKAQHKKSLLSRALAFMQHAVLPAAFQDWRQYSHAKRSRRGRAESAMHQMQLVRERNVMAAWHAAQLAAQHKKDLQRRALAHMRQAVVPAAFTAWAQKAAWLVDARRKTLRCLQV